MENPKMKRGNLLLFVISIALILFFSWGGYQIYSKTQEAILITPWEVVKNLEDAGYEITDVQEMETVSDKYGNMEIALSLKVDGHFCYIFKYTSWQQANKIVKNLNALNDRMGETSILKRHGSIAILAYRQVSSDIISAIKSTE